MSQDILRDEADALVMLPREMVGTRNNSFNIKERSSRPKTSTTIPL